MKVYLRIVDSINKVMSVIVVVFFAAAFLATFMQVVFRNLTTISVPWTDELSRYLVIYIVYLAAGLAARNGRLIRMEVLPMLLKMSDRQIRVFYWISSFITVLFALIVLYSISMTLSTNLNKVSASLGISMAIPYLALPIGSVWLAVNCFADLFDSHLKEREGKN